MDQDKSTPAISEKEQALSDEIIELKKTNLELTQGVDAAKELHDKAAKDLDAALAANSQLQKLIEAAPSTEAETKTADASKVNLADFSFEFKKKKYGFNFYKISLDGKALTADEIAVDEALQAKLISMESSMLKAL